MRGVPDFRDNALKPGDWVETSGGRIGEVVMRAWDHEASPGCLTRVAGDRDLVWVYDLSVEKGVHRFRREVR